LLRCLGECFQHLHTDAIFRWFLGCIAGGRLASSERGEKPVSLPCHRYGVLAGVFRQKLISHRYRHAFAVRRWISSRSRELERFAAFHADVTRTGPHPASVFDTAQVCSPNSFGIDHRVSNARARLRSDRPGFVVVFGVYDRTIPSWHCIPASALPLVSGDEKLNPCCDCDVNFFLAVVANLKARRLRRNHCGANGDRATEQNQSRFLQACSSKAETEPFVLLISEPATASIPPPGCCPLAHVLRSRATPPALRPPEFCRPWQKDSTPRAPERD